MSSLNRVILIGNLGKDPETRYTQGGDAVTNFSLATTERWKDKSGEKQEKTEWHRCVAFARTAEIAGEYLDKGANCCVEGRLQTRKWTDKDGIEKYSTEIVVDKLVLLSKGGGEKPARESASKPAGGGPKKSADDFDSDIPFVHNDLHGVDERTRFECRIGRAR